ncbi:MAG: phosphoadenosine phosphosulfate reductase family protein [Methanobacteriaceae archaeon]|nr:phosphoadenosine phosphosulfate reductase family protein [Methanobacteriaceae archaeon]
MYNVIWDTELNGILLTEGDSEINSPRPVYFEELDLLGFNKHWKYQKNNEPLLWAIGRNYYCNGKLVAKAKGGNMFEKPDLKIMKEGINLSLEPIDIKKVVEKNKEQLFVLENETLDFIEHTFKNYNTDEYSISVSYSGGKDSQVILDLVTRVIPYDEFVVIFSDTKLENSFTYTHVQKTIEEYKEKYPKIKFIISNPPRTALDFFKEFGLPSRFHRWCTSVLKTAPFNNLIREIFGDKSKVLVFEGVRTEESSQRSNYQRIAGGVKHLSIVNARPILYWNFSEVILYSWYRNLDLNKSYRFGLSRVGCSICPYSSEWSEFVNFNIEDTFKKDYIPLLEEYAKKRGLNDENDIKKFISTGQWKKRAGGKGLTNESSVNFSESNDYLKATIINPKENFLEWVKVLGDVIWQEKNSGDLYGELKVDDFTCTFKIKKTSNKEIIEIFNICNNVTLKSKLRRILYKSTFCSHCGVCEAECSTGALKYLEKLKIDSNSCNNCGNCIYFAVKGCLLSKSIDEGVGGAFNMKKRTGGIDKYSTFGIREEWLNEFLNFGDGWLDNNILGPKQVKAMIRWLIDAELIDPKTKKVSLIESWLNMIYKKEPLFVWLIIWNNIYYNSPVIKWYCDEIEWNSKTTKNELKEKIGLYYPNLSKGTLSNPIDAMTNMFDRSPLGDVLKMGLLEKKGRIVQSITKYGPDNIYPFVIAYSLYKVSENYGRTDFTVSELYNQEFNGGPYKLFGISRDNLERILLGLQADNEQILRVDLSADLDNIFLRKDLSPVEIIKIMGERV